MVVDDDSQIRELMCQALTQLGHTVTCAENGAIALEYIRKQLFDSVVTDILMPGRDGLELIGELRRRHPTVRIIAISGGGRASCGHYLDAAKSLGAHAVLAKPFSFSELTAALLSQHVSRPSENQQPIDPITRDFAANISVQGA